MWFKRLRDISELCLSVGKTRKDWFELWIGNDYWLLSCMCLCDWFAHCTVWWLGLSLVTPLLSQVHKNILYSGPGRSSSSVNRVLITQSWDPDLIPGVYMESHVWWQTLVIQHWAGGDRRISGASRLVNLTITASMVLWENTISRKWCGQLPSNDPEADLWPPHTQSYKSCPQDHRCTCTYASTHSEIVLKTERGATTR